MVENDDVDEELMVESMQKKQKQQHKYAKRLEEYIRVFARIQIR